MPATVTLEHYEVLTRPDGSLHELGRGAMGITYKGIDTRLRVPVALKVINSSHLHSESARQRFVREARSAAQLRHRNVASVFHLGEQDGNYFYAMEYIDGETVEALVKRQGPLPPALALRLTAQVARALNAAQARDLVHRDIKPANLMVVEEDDDLVVKVIDFGLAKVAFGGGAEAGEEPLTQGGFLGTPHFASPEQLEEREIDVRSDIYSLGVTLWYLLVADMPFTGSVARVVGQHLSKPPPFENLAGCPKPAVDLLRRMLAKDPAERPQTPADLRKEIDVVLKMMIDPVGAAPARRPATPPGSSKGLLTSIPDDLRFETGQTIAARYLITQDLGENEAGTSFRARDLQRDCEVRLLALHDELFADRDISDQIRRETAALTALAHPHILEVFDLTTIGRSAFLALGWTDGFTLREFLRTRRELEPEEALRLLTPAAAALDHATAHLARLELGLHHVLIHFPGRPLPTEELVHQAVPEWPEFVVKINPLATWRDLFAQARAAGQTLVVGAAHHERSSLPGRAGAVRALAAVVYELLGGVAATSRGGEYRPIGALGEAGNAVLERALCAPQSFASAAELIRQIAAPPAIEPPAVAQAAPPTAPAERVPDAAPLAAQLPPAPPTFTPPRRRPVLVPALMVAVAAAAVFALDHVRRRHQPSALAQTTPHPSPQTPPPPTPSFTPPLAVAPPTVRRMTPSPTPRASPTPPTRRALAGAAQRSAAALESDQQNSEALAAWLQMARDFPEWDTGRLSAELLLNRLRQRPGGFPPEEFATMQAQIREAARLGVVSAMMILAEELRAADSTEAFAWYCAAAAAGEQTAMTRAGLMLTNGDGTAKDLTKAVAYFQEAAAKGDPAAMLALGECYLDGKGVAPDPVKAVSLLQRSAEKRNADAANLLGDCLHRGMGIARNDAEAFRWFSQAADLGSVEAITNLGTLLMKGEGVKKDPAEAVAKFRKASQKGNLEAMYYYAGCLESGLGVKADLPTATIWFQKAAGGGHRSALEWCKARNLAPVPPARPE